MSLLCLTFTSSFNNAAPCPTARAALKLSPKSIRKEDLESPLIEDFLDCNQLFSDSDGDSSGTTTSTDTTPSNSPPRKTFKRLHINVDMSAAQYLTAGTHHSDRVRIDGLPICSSGPSTVPYSSEADPFSAVSCVSSFNCPAAADPSLLTPVSGAGSPPLQQRPQTKSSRNYHSQSAALGPQAPTPPPTSAFYGGYDVSSSSQSPSPMTVNPAATEAGHMEMTYIAHSPPNSHGPSSPKNDMGPVDPYLGSYTVSGPTENELTHHSAPEFHPYAVNMAVSGTFLTAGQQHLPVGGGPHMHQRMPSNGQPSIVSHPHPSQFRHHPTPHIGTIEDLRGDPGMFIGNGYSSRAASSPGRRPPSRKRPTPAKKASRTPKTTPRLGLSGQGLATGQFNPEDDEPEELTLRDDAPDEEKYLFELRKQFLSEKGKGMWEEMKAKFSEKHHNGNYEKAALQMKVSRAVAKYGVWPEREKQRLRAAWQYIEENRYAIMLAHMKENGGCKVWDWKPQHIEAMLVKMGLEERVPDPNTGSRRRKQKLQRRQASPQQHGGQPSNPVGDWHNGLGLHPHPGFPAHPHHMAGGAGMVPEPMAPTLTPEQEDEVLEQIYSKPGAGAEERSVSPDSGMDYGYDEDGESKDHRQQSERVARQACDQMMQAQPTVQPGGHFVSQ
ncbi:hypothetical protein VTK26DRAFT_6515 [Humicola hyalothermophila]